MKNVLLEIKGDNKIRVTEDSLFILHSPSGVNPEGGKFEFIFDTSGVTAKVISLFNAPTNGFYSLETISTHLVPDTSCDVKIKGVLGNKAESNYIGKIKITKDAIRTVSYLHDHVLVTGNGTKNHSQPILEIEANDVQASHGATTGRINEEDLFYLTSRGLSREEASSLIVMGFFEEIFDQITDAEILSDVKEGLTL